ncbi:MAG: hypothetical protein ACFB11_02610 [Paracoccaceae bacterium]
MWAELKRGLADPTKIIVVFGFLLTLHLTILGIIYSSAIFYIEGYSYLSLATTGDMIIAGSSSIGLIIVSLVIAGLTVRDVLRASENFKDYKAQLDNGKLEAADDALLQLLKGIAFFVPIKIIFFLAMPIIGAVETHRHTVPILPLKEDSNLFERYVHWGNTRLQRNSYLLNIEGADGYSNEKFFILGVAGDFTLIKPYSTGEGLLIRSERIQDIRYVD